MIRNLQKHYRKLIRSYKVDDLDISKVELYSLRRQVGIVPQDPLLFAGTISENISLADPECSSDEIVKAAEIAQAHQYLVNNYHTLED